MAWEFWIGIFLGGIISFLASVVANIFNTELVRFLDDRKIVFRERRRKNAPQLYNVIKDIHDGKRDKYVNLLRLSTISNYAAGSTIGGLCSFAVLFALSLPPDFSFTDTSLPISSFRLTFLLFLLFFAFSGLNGLKLSVDRHLNIAAALRDFDAYQAQFKAIWGELNS